LLTWILLAFVATAFQVFLVNESMYRSLTAVHQQVFQKAYALNSSNVSQQEVAVDWTESAFPETRVPVLALFEKYYGLPSNLSLSRGKNGNRRTVVLAGTEP